MGLFSHKRANVPVRPEAKWDYIQLNDFKADGPLTYIAYGYVFVSLTISMAVYTVDTFTAVNLLVFNKWSSEIQPAISFSIAKWIFSVCIILSFVNLAYEHLRAQIIIRRASVAESYLDNLAVRLQSVRIFNGKGWRRFLVFAELTKSKKGAEYIALFTYFSFQAWIRIIFCSGPRQVVNAVTLYSVYTAKLQINGDNFESSLESLFDKIGAFAKQDYQQALILSGMLFTLIIWVFSALSFIIAILFFVFFLWGWIPKEDGGLSGYCERKINKRLMKIVSSKVDAALADQERQRKKAELKAAKKTGALPPEERKATLPTLMPEKEDDKLPDMPMLYRNDTVATLPPYTSRPGTPGQGGNFELNKMRPMPSRSDTTTTASSRAPLLTAGADMGMSSPAFPSPNYGPPARSGTMGSGRSPLGGPTLNRTQTGDSGFGGPAAGGPQLSRMQTNNSGYSAPYSQSPSGYSPEDSLPPMPQRVLSPAPSTTTSYGPPQGPTGSYDDYFGRSASPAPSRQMTPAPSRQMTPGPSRQMTPGPSRQMTPGPMSDAYSSSGRASPAPSMQSRPGFNGYSQPPGPSYGQGPGGYPNRSQTGPVPYRGPPGPPQPQRNMTAPAPQQFGFQNSAPEEYFERPGTAHSQRSMPGGAPQRQPAQQQYQGYGGAYADPEARRGTPGPRY